MSIKFRRFEVCLILCVRNTNDLSLDQIVICDKKWILYDNYKQSSQWLLKAKVYGADMHASLQKKRFALVN